MFPDLDEHRLTWFQAPGRTWSLIRAQWGAGLPNLALPDQLGVPTDRPDLGPFNHWRVGRPPSSGSTTEGIGGSTPVREYGKLMATASVDGAYRPCGWCAQALEPAGTSFTMPLASLKRSSWCLQGTMNTGLPTTDPAILPIRRGVPARGVRRECATAPADEVVGIPASGPPAHSRRAPGRAGASPGAWPFAARRLPVRSSRHCAWVLESPT